jgi:hypothetical protein
VDFSILDEKPRNVAQLMCAFETGKKFMKNRNLVRFKNRLVDAWIAEFLSVTRVVR